MKRSKNTTKSMGFQFFHSLQSHALDVAALRHDQITQLFRETRPCLILEKFSRDQQAVLLLASQVNDGAAFEILQQR